MSVNSAIGLFSTPNVPITITTVELPLTAPQATASGAFNFNAVNAYVVPAGTWIVSSHINVESVNHTGLMSITLVRVLKNGVLIALYDSGNPAFFKTSTIVSACPPFVSSGTDTLTIQIQCQTSDVSTWQSYVAGVDARAYITKIAS
jgi:hypothetical protein